MKYVQGQIRLNKQETQDLLFALQVVEQNQNTYYTGNKKEDGKLNRASVKAYQTLHEVAMMLGAVND